MLANIEFENRYDWYYGSPKNTEDEDNTEDNVDRGWVRVCDKEPLDRVRILNVLLICKAHHLHLHLICKPDHLYLQLFLQSSSPSSWSFLQNWTTKADKDAWRAKISLLGSPLLFYFGPFLVRISVISKKNHDWISMNFLAGLVAFRFGIRSQLKYKCLFQKPIGLKCYNVFCLCHHHP